MPESIILCFELHSLTPHIPFTPDARVGKKRRKDVLKDNM